MTQRRESDILIVWWISTPFASSGVKVKGFGYVTFRELDDAGLLKQDYRRYYAAE